VTSSTRQCVVSATLELMSGRFNAATDHREAPLRGGAAARVLSAHSTLDRAGQECWKIDLRKRNLKSDPIHIQELRDRTAQHAMNFFCLCAVVTFMLRSQARSISFSVTGRDTTGPGPDADTSLSFSRPALPSNKVHRPWRGQSRHFISGGGSQLRPLLHSAPLDRWAL
jgi:hypothetical protein